MDGYYPQLVGPDGTSQLTANTRMAQALLQKGMLEMGYHTLGDVPAITIAYPSGSEDLTKTLTAIQEMVSNVLHLRIRLEETNFATFFNLTLVAVNNPAGVQSMANDWSTDYPDPQYWLSLELAPGAYFNSTNYGQTARERQARQELVEANSSLDATTRMVLYHQAEQQVINDAAWIPAINYSRMCCYVHLSEDGHGMPKHLSHRMTGRKCTLLLLHKFILNISASSLLTDDST